jgi:Dockerin type I domain
MISRTKKNMKKRQLIRKQLLQHAIRLESLERRSLMAADIFDTPAETVDMTYEYADVRGTIQTTEVRDVFKVSLADRPSLSVIARPMDDQATIEFDLFDTNGDAVTPIEDMSAEGILYFDGLASGDYFVVITSASTADVDYGMTVSTFPLMVTTGVQDYFVEPREDDVEEIGPDATELDVTTGFGQMGGTLDREGDVDVYRFTVGDDSDVYLHGWLLNGAEGLEVGVFKADGTELTDGRLDGAANWSNFEALAAGEYFLVVSADNTDAQDYWLTCSAGDFSVEPGPGVEPRPDDVEAIGPDATEIDLGGGFGQIGGTLDRAGDIDVYRFTVGEYDYLSGGAWRVDGLEGIDVKFYLADGTEVTGNTNGGSRSWASFESWAAGEYFVVVSGDNTESVDYWLNISAYDYVEPVFPEVTPRPDDANEIGEFATSLDFASGFASTDGMIESASDKDVFAINVVDATALYISGYAYRVDGSSFALQFFDADGNELVSLTDPTSGPNFLQFSDLADGTYFIVVSDSATEPAGYSFNVNANENLVYLGGNGGPVLFPGGNPRTDDGGSDGNPIEQPTAEFSMHNQASPTDVNGDNKNTPKDVLLVINWLNSNGVTNVASAKSQMAASGESAAKNSFLDINNDGTISPLDALLAINDLNRQYMNRMNVEAEGESSSDHMAVNVDWIFAQDDSESDLLAAF